MLRCSDPKAFLNALHQDHVFEIRILRVGHGNTTFGGFFDSIDTAISQMEAFEARHKPKAIYCTLNTFETGTKKRWNSRTKSQFEVKIEVNNAITPKGSGTLCQNDDITARRWLFIDIDPIRPTGINSSDIQHDAAVEMAKQIRDDMANDGWPMPILGMSGNGAYLLWRVDYKESEHPNLISSCVYAIVERYSPNAKDAKDAIDAAIQNGSYIDTDNATSTAMDIDKSVHNAARICKILGTQSRKGNHSELRPQRQSWFELPDVINVVPVEKLQELAGARAGKRRQNSLLPVVNESGRVSRETLPADDPMMKEEIDAVLAMWSKVPIEVQRTISNNYDEWRAAGCCLHFTHDTLYSRWVELSKLSSKYDESKCRSQWNGFIRPFPDENGKYSDRDITDRWVNQFFPNDKAAAKEASEMLRLTLDIEEPSVQSRLFKNLLLWNKEQRVPHTEPQLLTIFSVQHRYRVFEMSQKGHKVGVEAIESIPPDSDPQDIAMAGVQSNPVAKIVEGKESLGESDLDKAFKSNQKNARSVGTALSKAHQEIIKEWQLYRYDETPVVWELSMYGVSGSNIRLELSSDGLDSFAFVRKRVREESDFISPNLAKVWSHVVDELASRCIKMESNKDRDSLSQISKSIISLCLSSTASIERMEKKNTSINSAGMQRGTNVFYEGDPSNVNAFWVNIGTIYHELFVNLDWMRLTKHEYFAAVRKLGIDTSKKAPRAIYQVARTYSIARIDREVFAKLCQVADKPFDMALYSHSATSEKTKSTIKAYNDELVNGASRFVEEKSDAPF